MNLRLLFKTVYGAEIESIYFWLAKYGPAEKKDLILSYSSISEGAQSSPATIDDTILFLLGAGIVGLNNNLYYVNVEKQDSLSFKVELLKYLRSVSNERSELDSYFIGLIDILYVKPDVLFCNRLHRVINSLDLPMPCSEEKVNAWKRVLEYLGLGFRGYGGLTVYYEPKLLMKIINKWGHSEGPLQDFLEEHLDLYLPWVNSQGDIANAVKLPLQHLENVGVIELSSKQDLPNKNYLGKRRIKWLARKEL